MISRRIYKSALLAMGSVIALFAFGAAPALAVQHLPFETFGSAEQPTFGAIKAVAVDQATGDVLVADGATNSILQYHADGTPAPFSGLGSNEITTGGLPGEEVPLEFGGSPAETQIAIDNSKGPAAGDIYVTQALSHLIYIFSETGESLGSLNVWFNSGAGGEAFSFGEACGVAVDKKGVLYVSEYSGVIYKFQPGVNPVRYLDGIARFTGLEEPCNLAAGSGSSAGKLFVSSFAGGRVSALNAQTGSNLFQLAQASDGGLSIDPSGGHVYVAEGEGVSEYRGERETAPITSIPAAGPVQGVAIDGGSRSVYVATGSPNLEVSPPGPLVPTIFDQSGGGAVRREATVEATINPEGSATTYQVEYGTTGAYGELSPTKALSADAEDHRVSIDLIGLAPATTYHFRFIATNAAGPTQGSDQTVTTFAEGAPGEVPCANALFRQGPAEQLADCRAYEMVSPVDKNNSDIHGLINVNSMLTVLDQSALSGEKLTYTTSQAFGDTQGAPYESQYIASRGEDGWANTSINPAQGVSKVNAGQRLDLEYRLFSPDLCEGLLLHFTDPPLAPGAEEGVSNVYRRPLCEGSGYETLTTTPHEQVLSIPNIQGMSADDRCALVSVPRPVPQVGELLESCDGHPVSVSILPDGEPAPEGVAGTGPETPAQELDLREANRQGAISENGSRVYFSPGGGFQPIYLRENAQARSSALGPGNVCTEPGKACTILVSENEEKSIFWGASPDGSRAFYMTGEFGSTRTTLYEFDLGTESSTPIAQGVTSVMGVDEEGNRIYFSSTEELDSGAVPGQPNLYMYEDTGSGPGRYRFIGTLTETDASLGLGIFGKRVSALNQLPLRRVSRVSPDGLHAVFAAYAPLTGYDNTDRASGEPDLEVFRYDATADGGAGSLLCVSCNPSGEPPAGRAVLIEGSHPGEGENWASALIPTYETSFYGPRVISTSGNRVFFDSYEALLPADTDGTEDVYEWEAPGGGGPAGGGCTESSASFSLRNGGCLSLISSGESSSDSEFVDASPDGRDVFFSTASSLAPQDPGLIDIYDAREGGGFPSPPGRAAACEGEACQGPVSPPNDQTPASASFKGPGNVVECAKGKVKKNGKCVAKKSSKKKHHKKRHHKKKSSARRADDDRRAGR
jgi:hypothetical protein